MLYHEYDVEGDSNETKATVRKKSLALAHRQNDETTKSYNFTGS